MGRIQAKRDREEKAAGALLVIGIAIAIVIEAYLVIAAGQGAAGTGAMITVGGYSYHVLLATNQAQWQQGLMNYTFACSAPGLCVNGMLFVFPSSGTECFWMKDTPEPLAQIWISNGTVTSVYNASPESTASVCGAGNEVLELYSRLSINAAPGDKVEGAG